MMPLLRKIGSIAYRGWMAFAHALGYVNTKVLLTVFYIVIIGPAWLVCTILRVDLLGSRWGRSGTLWRVKLPTEQTLDATRHQF